MKVEANEYLIVYSGHNMAGYLYQKLIKKPCEVELVSTPCKISYGCSQSIKFKEKDMDIILSVAQKMRTSPKGVYKIIKKGTIENYEKIK